MAHYVERIVKAFLNDQDAKGQKTRYGTIRIMSTEIDGMRCLVGYEWAIYAVKVNDVVVAFPSWAEYSRTSHRHISCILGNLVPGDVVDLESRPTVRHFDLDPAVSRATMSKRGAMKNGCVIVGTREKAGCIEAEFGPRGIHLRTQKNKRFVSYCWSETSYILDILADKDPKKLRILKMFVDERLAPGYLIYSNPNELKGIIQRTKAWKRLARRAKEALADRTLVVRRTLGGVLVVMRSEPIIYKKDYFYRKPYTVLSVSQGGDNSLEAYTNIIGAYSVLAGRKAKLRWEVVDSDHAFEEVARLVERHPDAMGCLKKAPKWFVAGVMARMLAS